jgi:hypothetical protein
MILFVSHLSSVGNKTVICQSTQGLKSKQNDLQMISVTSPGGQVSIEPVIPKLSTTAPIAPTMAAMDVNKADNHPIKTTQNEKIVHSSFIDVPSSPSNGPQVSRRATQSNTLSMPLAVPLPLGKESVSVQQQNHQKGSNGKLKK